MFRFRRTFTRQQLIDRGAWQSESNDSGFVFIDHEIKSGFIRHVYEKRDEQYELIDHIHIGYCSE